MHFIPALAMPVSSSCRGFALPCGSSVSVCELEDDARV